MASSISNTFKNGAVAKLASTSASRYRAYFYNTSSPPSVATAGYTATGQIANSTNYPNTGVAATDGVVLSSTVSGTTLAFADKVVTSAAGETIGPVSYVLICDTTDSNNAVAFLDYSAGPQTASNGGAMTLDFAAATITVSVA